jgi:glycosyltransferase involved in cell wall biosynthesis
MRRVTEQDIQALTQSDSFDPAWYEKEYPDVKMLGMDPATHYLAYGSLMGRSPGPDFPAKFIREVFVMKPETEPVARLARLTREQGAPPTPKPKKVLSEASKLVRLGDSALALTMARRYLPPELQYTVHILEANAALRARDFQGWQDHVNAYLSHLGVPPIALRGMGTPFDRLACAQDLPPVADGPLVSVLMPAWNAEKTLRKAAQSILAQTWRNLELLIVDDASTDGTPAIIQDIAAQDPRVRALRNAVNVGPYVSKNIALRHARGEWITGQDADDWSHPHRIESHLALALAHDAAASLTYMLRIAPYGLFTHFTPIGDFSFDGAARVSSISTLFKAEFLRTKLGYWDCVRFGADSEMIARAKVVLGKAFQKFQTIGMICLDVPGSLTNDPETGIRTTTGLSEVRRRYKESWHSYHSKIKEENKLIDFPPKLGRPMPSTGHEISLDTLLQVTQGRDEDKKKLHKTDIVLEDKIRPPLLFPAKKIACIFFENVICDIISKKPDQIFDVDFFKSKTWPNKPNSTARLSLVNYQSMRRLQKEGLYDIDFIVNNNEQIKNWEYILDKYDTIIFNQIAAHYSHASLVDFINTCIYKKVNRNNKNIIFGTEVGFFMEEKRGVLTKEQVDFIYKNCCLLRHTARTDAPLYSDAGCLDSHVCEFEIGIDTDIVQSESKHDRKNQILFVAAPEGRITKDNTSIENIISALKEEDIDKHKIKILKPPYATTDYWKELQKSNFLIFTSNGETFSYVLNDAKSMGVISFFKRHMYCTTVGQRFCVDAYPHLGERYSTPKEVAQRIQELIKNKEETDSLSRRARQEVTQQFGGAKICQNLDTLLSGKSLLTNNLVVFDKKIHVDKDTINRYAHQYGAQYVLSIGNNILKFNHDGFSEYIQDKNVSIIKYFLEYKDGKYFYTVSKTDKGIPYYKNTNKEHRDQNDDAIAFWDIIFRSYKIRHIQYIKNTEDDAIDEPLLRVAKARGLKLSVSSVTED